jgi:hypothetical protein
MSRNFSLLENQFNVKLKPKTSHLLFMDLEIIIAMQNDKILFENMDDKNFTNKIIDIEKKLFSDLFFGDYGFKIGIYNLPFFNSNSWIEIDTRNIKSILELPDTDDKSLTIFSMQTNYLLICDYDTLKYIVANVDIYDMQHKLDYQYYSKLDEIAAKANFGFAIKSVFNANSGFDFCGSGNYILETSPLVPL